jgi:hypothetical protein
MPWNEGKSRGLNSACGSCHMGHNSGMAHVVRDTLRKMLCAGAIVAGLTGTAFAQFTPGLTLRPDSERQLTPEEKEKQKALDEAYRSAIGKIPDKQKSADPWGNIRPAESPKSKQGQK